MTRLARIRADIECDMHDHQKDRAWLLETVDEMKKAMVDHNCSAIPCRKALARLEEPDDA